MENQTEFTPKKTPFAQLVDQGDIFWKRDKTDLVAQIPTPITNRGVKSKNSDIAVKVETTLDKIPANKDPLEDLQVVHVGSGNKTKIIRIPLPDKSVNPDYAFFDWVNFTFKKEDYPQKFEHDDDYVLALSYDLFDIFGYGVRSKRSVGLNMYQDSWVMGKDGWGYVCIGGQNNSVMVSVKAQGLYAARKGWEKRLYNFITSIDSAKLTRVDLAHDSFQSKRTLNDYFDMYQADLFTSRGRPPSINFLGDWINENNKGRTLNIGNRSSGKVLRIYEKGLQLGRGFSDKFPSWVRIELEIRADQRILPPEMLLNPAQYLAGAYPALAFICESQEVIETIKKFTEIKVDASIEVTRHQFGKHIKAHAELFGAEQTIYILTLGVEDLPERLDVDDYLTFDKEAYCEHEGIELINFIPRLAEYTKLDYEKFKNKPFLNTQIN